MAQQLKKYAELPSIASYNAYNALCIVDYFIGL